MGIRKRIWLVANPSLSSEPKGFSRETFEVPEAISDTISK